MLKLGRKLGDHTSSWTRSWYNYVTSDDNSTYEEKMTSFWGDSKNDFDGRILDLIFKISKAPTVKDAHLCLNLYLLSLFGSENKVEWEDFKLKFGRIMEESNKSITALEPILDLQTDPGTKQKYLMKSIFEKFLRMYSPLEPSQSYRTSAEFYTITTILDAVRFPYVHGFQVSSDDDPQILRDAKPGDFFFRMGSQGNGIYALVFKTETDLERFRILSDPKDLVFQVKGSHYQSLAEIVDKSAQIFGSKLENPVNRVGETVNKGIKILALDGGGIRGLIPIKILQRIEKDMGKPIHELFDVICGTSTGGILALGLGIKQVSLQLCEEKYSTMGTSIFKKGILSNFRQLIGEKHSTTALEKILKEIAGDTTHITSQLKPKCFAIAVNYETNTPFLFRNYSPKSSPFLGTDQVKLWEACRATSAAPTFFSRCEIPGVGTFIDGAMGHNNPTREALQEVSVLMKEDPAFKDLKIECVVSIGTGEDPIDIDSIRGKSDWALADSVKKMKEIAVNSDQRAEEDSKNCELNQIPYFRLNPSGIGAIPLDEDDDRVLKLMKDKTSEYLLKVETQKKLREMYTKLQ